MASLPGSMPERMQWKLGPRLEAVASFVRQGERLADIGTDHGLLPVWLREQGLVPFAIAADLNPGPLDAARQTAAQHGASGIDFRLCNGLAALGPDEVDTVVIAGMSGETMQAILGSAGWSWVGKRLILQPMTHQQELLEWLYAQGFHLVSELLPREHGSLYRVFCVEWGAAPLPRPAFLWGSFQDSPYARRQALRLQKAITGLERATAPDGERLRLYHRVLEDMKDAYGWNDIGRFDAESAAGEQAGF